MATVNKDFRVKHGLIVADGATFGGTVTVATPTQNTHAATKLYVDSKGAIAAPASTAPASPTNGQLWLDTITQRLYIYLDTEWMAQAAFEDTINLRDHIHDTSIDGNGTIVSEFQDAGFYYENGLLVSAGFYNTSVFADTWIGGQAIDNFN
jgi:hypothetical protein